MASQTAEQRRATAITAAEAESATIEGLRGRKDPGSIKARRSAGARKANRIREIHEAEADLALAGKHTEPWQDSPSPSRMTPMTQAEIETNLAAARAAKEASPYESTKHTLDQRITALLKSAAKRGYEVS